MAYITENIVEKVVTYIAAQTQPQRNIDAVNRLSRSLKILKIPEIVGKNSSSRKALEFGLWSLKILK